MFSYTAYGLGIHSVVPLPELVAGQTRADVVIRFGTVGRALSDADGAKRCVRGSVAEVYLFWSDIGAFLVREGCEIIVEPVAGVEERVLRLFILGPALGVLLNQRDLLVFHASVIAFSFGAVAFAARKGHGKSTIAAALHVRGHALVADDIMALDNAGDCLMAQPGFPQLKLWPDAVEAIGEIPASLPVLKPDYEKRARRVLHGFAGSSRPLRCVFVLGVGQNLEIVSLRPLDALMRIMPHWYGALFRGELLPVLGLEQHFRACMALVEKVPIYLLQRPASLAMLPEVARMVEEYLASDTVG